MTARCRNRYSVPPTAAPPTPSKSREAERNGLTIMLQRLLGMAQHDEHMGERGMGRRERGPGGDSNAERPYRLERSAQAQQCCAQQPVAFRVGGCGFENRPAAAFQLRPLARGFQSLGLFEKVGHHGSPGFGPPTSAGRTWID